MRNEKEMNNEKRERNGKEMRNEWEGTKKPTVRKDHRL